MKQFTLLWPQIVLIVSILISFLNCSLQTDHEVKSNAQQFLFPAALRTDLPNCQIKASLLIDDNQKLDMNIIEDSASVVINEISEGLHVFKIEFICSSSQFSNDFVLAVSQQQIDIQSGANTLKFNQYDFPDLDSDGDNNLIELKAGTNPADSASNSAGGSTGSSNAGTGTALGQWYSLGNSDQSTGISTGTDNSRHPSISISRAGDVLVSWAQVVNGGPAADLLFVRYDQATSTWEEIQDISHPNAEVGKSAQPSLVTSPWGVGTGGTEIHALAWVEQIATNHSEIYVKYLQSGVWSEFEVSGGSNLSATRGGVSNTTSVSLQPLLVPYLRTSLGDADAFILYWRESATNQIRILQPTSSPAVVIEPQYSRIGVGGELSATWGPKVGTNVVQRPTEMKVLVYESTFSTYDVIHAAYTFDDISNYREIGGSDSRTDWGLCPINHYCRHPKVTSYLPSKTPDITYDPNPVLSFLIEDQQDGGNKIIVQQFLNDSFSGSWEDYGDFAQNTYTAEEVHLKKFSNGRTVVVWETQLLNQSGTSQIRMFIDDGTGNWNGLDDSHLEAGLSNALQDNHATRPAIAIGPSPNNPSLSEAVCVSWVQKVEQVDRIYVRCHDI